MGLVTIRGGPRPAAIICNVLQIRLDWTRRKGPRGNPVVTGVQELPVGDVAPLHRFDAGNLERYLRTHLDGFSGELSIRQFQGGASNPTFLLSTHGGVRYVMRKKPPGALLPSAHQVDREYRIMRALAG